MCGNGVGRLWEMRLLTRGKLLLHIFLGYSFLVLLKGNGLSTSLLRCVRTRGEGFSDVLLSEIREDIQINLLSVS